MKNKKDWLKIVLITVAILFVIIEVGFIIANAFINNLDNVSSAEMDNYINEYVVHEQFFRCIQYE